MAMATNKKMPCEEDDTRKILMTFEKYLPCDALEIILSRLPIKSILRFKAVSKSWNILTLDPRFARLHLQFKDAHHKTDEDQNLFMWSPYGTNRYRLAKFNGSELEVVASNLRFPENMTHSLACKIVGSCDGFFLLYDQCETYVLWNPITGSNTSFAAYLGYPGYAHGICYDSLNDDYKVVYITRKWYTVYSCRTRSWTESEEFTYLGVDTNPAGVTIRGVSYWVFSSPGIKESDICRYEIVYFDTVECGFKTLNKPDELQETDVIRLTSLNGSLCLYRRSNDHGHLQIWVLLQENNNNDWIKLTDVQDLSPLGDYCCHVKPLYMTEDDRIVLQDLGAEQSCFMVYDIKNQTSERAWKLDDERHCEVVTGLGSLVFPTPENLS